LRLQVLCNYLRAMKFSTFYWGPLALAAAAEVPFVDVPYGHFEIHIDYQVIPENPDAGWRISASYNLSNDFNDSSKVIRLDPASTVFLATPATLQSIPASLPRFGAAGAPFWILPQSHVLGAPFVGVRATMNPGIFQARVGNHHTPSPIGSVALRLVEVTGTGPDAGGHFATWETEFNTANFYFDTSDGITAADEIPTIPVAAHTHYHWGMTRPGMYRVTCEVSGKLNPQFGGGVTSARQTFTFGVPFSGRLAAGAEWRLADHDGQLVMCGADSAESVAYRGTQGFFEATEGATSASLALPGAHWEHHGTLSTAPASIGNGIGISPQAASAGLDPTAWSNLQLQFVAKRGPGEVGLMDDGTLLASSLGGFSEAQTISLAGGARRPLVTAFTATGIYHLQFLVRGEKNGQAVESSPITLIVGAGLPVDYDFAAWCASWERTAGVAAGSLADPTADLDGDGIPNGVEFALAAHGLDPTVADGNRLPQPRPGADGAATFDFLRDTYKDPLDESHWKLRVGFSDDLQSWREISPRNPGRPLEFWETAAEAGNAYGRIMSRRLRWAEPARGAAYFRFAAEPPTK
jgi:surface-anchored protein